MPSIVSKTRKESRPSLSSLQSKADRLQSEYIRRKASDANGMVACVSCGAVKHWKEMDAGHFVPKSRGAAIRYVEENLHSECPGCNRFNEGHLINYTRYMIDMYGIEKIDELQAEAKKVLSASQKRALIEEAIEYYSQKLKEL